MEQNLPIVAKRVWSIVRVVYFMLKKTISKKKLLLNLNFMAKRGKIAGKTISNLAAVFHHHSHGGGSQLGYEFSCSDRPALPKLFNAVLEMINKNDDEEEEEGSSPALPGFRRAARVGRLPVKEAAEESGMVDKAADEFIRKFYTQLKCQ